MSKVAVDSPVVSGMHTQAFSYQTKGAEVDRLRNALEKLSQMDVAQVETLKGYSLEACRITFNLRDRVDEFGSWVRLEILG